MAEHHFHVKAEWPGGRNRVGSIDAGNLKTDISIPTEMDGPGVGTNPDEMLLGAAATCYVITLATMIEHTGLPLQELSHDAEAIVDVTKGVYTYKKIIHKPTVLLKDTATERDYKRLRRLIERAETSCMISRAIQGNVELEVQPNLQ